MKKKIVLIEDEEYFAEPWRCLLIKCGYEVCHYPTAFHFFESSDLSDIEAIIVDRLSPGYDAVENSFPVGVLETFPNFNGPIFLCSVLNRGIEKGSNGFALKIPKKPATMKNLMDFYENCV
jgi:hypothetical protein